MSHAYAIAETGMKAFQQQVDAIANNVANLNSPGFKATRIEFEELLGASADASGRGVRAAPTLAGAASAPLATTASVLDLAIDGPGYLRLIDADGVAAYGRGGRLSVGPSGTLQLNGLALDPPLALPAGVEAPRIDADGRVVAPGPEGELVLGRLELVLFQHPEALVPAGPGRWRATTASGEPVAVPAGAEGVGSLAQYRVEQSNVDLTQELVNLMAAQRAFALSSKVFEAADSLAARANELLK